MAKLFAEVEIPQTCRPQKRYDIRSGWYTSGGQGRFVHRARLDTPFPPLIGFPSRRYSVVLTPECRRSYTIAALTPSRCTDISQVATILSA